MYCSILYHLSWVQLCTDIKEVLAKYTYVRSILAHYVTDDNACFLCDFKQSTTETFDWDEKIQSQILGAFFYGYVITQIPGGLLAARFGGKWLFGIGVLCTSVFTLLTPLAAEAGEGWLFATRFLEGVGEVSGNRKKLKMLRA